MAFRDVFKIQNENFHIVSASAVAATQLPSSHAVRATAFMKLALFIPRKKFHSKSLFPVLLLDRV